LAKRLRKDGESRGVGRRKHTRPERTKPKTPEEEGGTIAWPAFRADAWIPRPAALEGDMRIYVDEAGRGPGFGDGMLGAPWFADRTWELDYAKGTLRLLPKGALPDVDAKHRVKLGFQSENGAHTTHFPRITVRVDGEPLELLLDTGAMTTVRPEAIAKVGEDRPAGLAASFIVRSVLRKWREQHPDWLVVEGAETPGKAAMIRVPAVELAGHTVGPVWFTERLDPNFHEWMSQWMDQRIDGALGGNAFRGLRVTLDYPSETATFEKSGD
jgi:hypothetical protein